MGRFPPVTARRRNILNWGMPPVIEIWYGDDLADWRPAACTGWEAIEFNVLIATAGRFRHDTRTLPLRIEKIATNMQNNVHSVSPCIELNSPAFNSLIAKDDSVTHTAWRRSRPSRQPCDAASP